VQTELNLGIYRAFRDAGIQMPFPQREVRLVDSRDETPVAR
jgi:small-conductance mechanosensitive channel